MIEINIFLIIAISSFIGITSLGLISTIENLWNKKNQRIVFKFQEDIKGIC